MRCCGTTRRAFEMVTITRRTTPRASTNRKTCTPFTDTPRLLTVLLAPDERGGALDLDHADLRAGVDDLARIVRPGLPEFATDLDHAPALGDLLDHRALGAFESVHTDRGAVGTGVQPPLDSRPDRTHSQGGHYRERDHLDQD